MAEIKVLIAAAGAGTRAGLPYPKTLHPVRGEPILTRLMETLRAIDPRPTVIVSPAGREAIAAALAERGLHADLVEQPKPSGMGDAILCFRDAPAAAQAEHLLVVWGDIPLLQPETVEAVCRAHLEGGNDFTFATRHVEEAYTIVARGPDGEVTSLTETREAGLQPGPGERDIGLFVLRVEPVLSVLAERLPGAFGRSTGEHGFLYLVRHLAERGLRVEALPVATELDLVSLNRLSDLDGIPAEAASPDAHPAPSGKTLAMLLPDMAGGGAERVALAQIDYFLRAGHRVDLLLLRRQGELLDLVPPQVRIVDLAAPRIRQALGPLVRYLRSSPPHALQALMWPVTVLAVLARLIARAPTRLVLADHTTLSRQYADLGRAGSFFLRRSLGASYPRADARVAVSEDAAADLSGLARLDRNAIEVIYNPVADPPPEGAADPDIEALWGVPHGRRILTVGKLKDEKEHALLIRAFARMDRAQDARLMIVGNGPQEDELRQVAAQTGVGERVVLPGFTTDPWPFYRSADLFVLSSRFEGYPLVLVEAMKCGLSVVSTDCKSGPREILDGGRFGRLVPVGDEEALSRAMAEALADPAQSGVQIRRAQNLAGSSACRRYLQLMLGP
jgi:glycosyltransferase involved in cell wall biosynthesis/CTP:molybdopterin cytidylyltransferase MocA